MSLAIGKDDAFFERIAKLIPIEVLSLLLLPVTLLPADTWRGWSLVAVGAGFVLVPVILYWDAARWAAHVSLVQYVARSLAFLAWAVVLSAPFGAWLRLDARIAMASALLVPLVGERALARRIR
jgi:predicted membrane protein